MCAKIIMYCKYEVRLYIKYVKYLKNIFIENIFLVGYDKVGKRYLVFIN
jgi:hypothetical protein